MNKDIFFSTIIATVGRQSLSRAVYSVLDQDIALNNFEIIVVNDSGKPLPKYEWQNSEKVKLLHTNKRERCFARNAGAAASNGKYLHFLDDDDWLLPGAIGNIIKVAESTHAGWIYGTCRLIGKDGSHLTDHHIGVRGNGFVNIMTAAEWIPLQASFVESRLFFEVGGFDPLIPGIEDFDLCRKILSRTYLATTNAIIACVIRDRDNTTSDYSKYLINSIWSRDKILGENRMFSKLLKSARSSYWQGRVVRACLTCVLWNLRNKKVIIALDRAILAFAAFISSGFKVCSPAFWRALTHPHTRKNVF